MNKRLDPTLASLGLFPEEKISQFVSSQLATKGSSQASEKTSVIGIDYRQRRCTHFGPSPAPLTRTRYQSLGRSAMKRSMQLFGLESALALSFITAQVFAQQSDTQQPIQQQTSQQNPGNQGQQAPDAQGAGQSNVQVFTGVITKVGDKCMLQDSANSTSYDIDQQDLAKKYEGQKVRIKGTLDPDGKTIHVK